MYRTHHIYDLILKGVPESLRGELWLIFSGSVNEVSITTEFTLNSITDDGDIHDKFTIVF